jgi:retron-type reverse transcriptase
MKLLDRATGYRNLHLAYHRVLKGEMNRELQTSQEKSIFKLSIPAIYGPIKDALNNHDFNFNALDELLKPKKKNADNSWGTRPLVRMNFYDAVIAQAITNVLAEHISTLLDSENYGYKFQGSTSVYMYQDWKKGYASFVRAELEAVESDKYQFVIEADIEDFYATINHEILINELNSYLDVEDTDTVLAWIKKILKIPIRSYDGQQRILDNGVPQGTLYSPLLALFYIRNCFKEIREEMPRVRCFGYVDDLRIYCESEEQAKDILHMLNAYMASMNLKLNQTKTKIYPVDENKKKETWLMGRASNLNRAIKDDVILGADGKNQMKSRLRKLLNEVGEFFHETDAVKSKFVERLRKFVDYRVSKLLDSKQDWLKEVNKWLGADTAVDLFESNFLAVWHILYLGASSSRQKRHFISKLQNLIKKDDIQNLSYVKYICLQYLFRYSPLELRLSDRDVSSFITKYTEGANDIDIKAILSHAHSDWFKYFDKLKTRLLLATEDEELRILQYLSGLTGDLTTRYQLSQGSSCLALSDDNVIFSYRGIDVSTLLAETGYLETEQLKYIEYKKLNYELNAWSIKLENELDSLWDIKQNLTEKGKREILVTLFK